MGDAGIIKDVGELARRLVSRRCIRFRMRHVVITRGGSTGALKRSRHTKRSTGKKTSKGVSKSPIATKEPSFGYTVLKREEGGASREYCKVLVKGERPDAIPIARDTPYRSIGISIETKAGRRAVKISKHFAHAMGAVGRPPIKITCAPRINKS